MQPIIVHILAAAWFVCASGPIPRNTFHSQGAESARIELGRHDPESDTHTPGRGSAGVPEPVSLMGRLFGF